MRMCLRAGMLSRHLSAYWAASAAETDISETFCFRPSDFGLSLRLAGDFGPIQVLSGGEDGEERGEVPGRPTGVGRRGSLKGD